jgi:hypothetical protein
MSNAQGQHAAEVRATVTITRAATGLQETVEIRGFVNPEQARALGLLPPNPETPDERHPHGSGT